MRVERKHANRATARRPRRRTWRPSWPQSWQPTPPALPVTAAATGAALAVLALYGLADHGLRFASLSLHADGVLLTGANIAPCGALALMFRRNRGQRDEIDALKLRLEEFSDRAWQIKEVEEHVKSFLEAQGDVIVRRDRTDRITYANDAFCALAGLACADLVGGHFALPVIEQREVALLPDEAEAPPGKSSHDGASLAIVVAEDDEINAPLAHALLACLGHRPTLVATGAQVIDAWLGARGRRAYDLILMEVHMPGMDGIAAAQRIRAAELAAGCARTPIVALSTKCGQRRSRRASGGRPGRVPEQAARPRAAGRALGVRTRRDRGLTFTVDYCGIVTNPCRRHDVFGSRDRSRRRTACARVKKPSPESLGA